MLFICFSAALIPIVIFYMVVGLAISTVAVGMNYFCKIRH